MSGSRIGQCALTLVHTVDRSRAPGLAARLTTLGDDVKGQQTFRLERVPTVHFARWVVLDPPEEAQLGSYEPLLLFESNHDGDSAALVSALLREMGPGLHSIYADCVGYPGKGAPDDVMQAFLLSGSHDAEAFHIAHHGKTVAAIRAESELREALEDYFDQNRATLFPLSPSEIRARARRDVLDTRPSLPAAVAPPARWADPMTMFSEPQLIALAIALLPLTAALAAAFWYLRGLERKDLAAPIERSAAHVARVAQREDQQKQNPLTHVVELKEGAFRHAVLRLVLFVINLFARYRFNVGDLNGIRTIHFARWVLIDGGRRLLFFSNYDGSWESYLGDFIDQAHRGLTAIWSNTRGFPEAELLMNKGALAEEKFKAWTRMCQVQTHFWYSAYPRLTTTEVATNAAIRSGLESDLDPAGWLALFRGGGPTAGSSTAPEGGGETEKPKAPTGDTPLDQSDIQSVVLTGHGDHKLSHFFVVGFGAARPTSLVAYLAGEASSVADTGKDVLVNVALTADGLLALGASEDSLGTFGVEFQQGMVTEARSFALGDVATSDPKEWEWGYAARARVHALVLVYAKSGPALEACTALLTAAIAEAGCGVLHDVRSTMLGDRKEHFGFVDGISQPVVQGFDTPRGPRNETVPAGEFVFGPPNAYVASPDAPTFKGPEGDAIGRAPDADVRACAGAGALGKNGTYLVARDLRQDVAAFNAFLRTAGPVVHPAMSPTEAAARLGAEAVGRWKDGRPLATTLDDSKEPDVMFADDPEGVKCPITAHVRRANPRDSLTLDPEASRVIANRHRILRRGRNFGAFLEGDSEAVPVKRGMFFMCINTNIARQFEFIQQTWMQSPKFGGLRTDRDPLLGRAAMAGEQPTMMTVPTEPLRARVGLSRFVDVKGGAYFFLPGRRALKAIAWMATRT